MSKIKNKEFNNFESLQIKLASPEKIEEWSYGEVTDRDTINYKTSKPVENGLFSQRIFGPLKDYVCECGTAYQPSRRGEKCPKCGVEITEEKVRRERMGHINLVTPVSHIWYFKSTPSRIGEVLGLKPKELERVLYFAEFIVTDPGDSELEYKQLINYETYDKVRMEELKNGTTAPFKAGMGAETIKKLLSEVDIPKLATELREELKNATGQKKVKLVKRLEVVDAFRLSGNKPEWMILDKVPVIPPSLRPLVPLEGGRFAVSDLNELYKSVIIRNNRLKELLSMPTPDPIIRNEKRMLQEAVDNLIDNGRRGRAKTGSGGRQLKSLSDMLKGKQGRFRQNLLGKRVDYSGRSVIVVGPELKFYQCGLPKTMAAQLFKPFIVRELIKREQAYTIKKANAMVEDMVPEVWDALDYIIKDHPVLLNRAPTLHRLGIQAFEPVLVEGKAIKLHPLVCTAFNADFDGDQMAVHVPLSVEAQAEARFLMLSVNNILSPKDGAPITTPTQDMVLGSYYLTFSEESDRTPKKGDGKRFSDIEEMLMSYQAGEVDIHAIVKVRMKKDENDRGKMVESTVGRFIFNQGVPQDLGFRTVISKNKKEEPLNREKDPYSLEVDTICGKKQLENLIGHCFETHGNQGTVAMIDYIKRVGYHYSTIAAISIGISDMEIPADREAIIKKSDEKVEKIEKAYKRGLLSDKERYEQIISIWQATRTEVEEALMRSLDKMNNLKIMADSGARGSKSQISQIGGMRGLMGSAAGKTVEVPIKSNFRQGLSVLEYFISANGARKGLADTALRTADSGYLTRRLVDVSHGMIITEEDCGTDEGFEVFEYTDKTKDGEDKKGEAIKKLSARIAGRYAAEDIIDPKTGAVLVHKNKYIDDHMAEAIENKEIKKVKIRSVLTCGCENGICAKCYGRNLATGEEKVLEGEAVGIIAAESIGEPGTQLTMRTFHTGGVAGADITSGLPRVEELFEARKSKRPAKICIEDGEVISITDTEHQGYAKLVVQGENEKHYIARKESFKVKEGDKVKKGEALTKGSLNPYDVMDVLGVNGLYNYIMREVLAQYHAQSVEINDKHIEVIVRQMVSKYEVENTGDTDLLPGERYTKHEIERADAKAIEKGLEPSTGAKRQLLGITKAALATTSFLSAASFQETTRVLTDAAIKGKVDNLVGLKENVMIGKLIPAGTGHNRYRDINIEKSDELELELARQNEIFKSDNDNPEELDA